MGAVAGAVSCSRSFAAAAASPDHVQLPLKLFGVSGRYASSLYVAAVRKKTLAQVADDMATIEALAKENQKFRFFLDNPFIRADVKANVLSEVLPKAGVSPTCQHFFSILAENNRLDDTLPIASAFKKLITAEKGEIDLVITSATPLYDSDTKKIVNGLPRADLGVTASTKFNVSNEVDEALVSGYVVDVGGKYTIDHSTASRIKKIAKSLETATSSSEAAAVAAWMVDCGAPISPPIFLGTKCVCTGCE